MDRQILRVGRGALPADKRMDRRVLRVDRQVPRVDKRVLQVDNRVLRMEK